MTFSEQRIKITFKAALHCLLQLLLPDCVHAWVCTTGQLILSTEVWWAVTHLVVFTAYSSSSVVSQALVPVSVWGCCSSLLYIHSDIIMNIPVYCIIPSPLIQFQSPVSQVHKCSWVCWSAWRTTWNWDEWHSTAPTFESWPFSIISPTHLCCGWGDLGFLAKQM